MTDFPTLSLHIPQLINTLNPFIYLKLEKIMVPLLGGASQCRPL